jgi:hypothetical protein
MLLWRPVLGVDGRRRLVAEAAHAPRVLVAPRRVLHVKGWERAAAAATAAAAGGGAAALAGAGGPDQGDPLAGCHGKGQAIEGRRSLPARPTC